MKPKIYIAGKIAGDPDYKAKFDAAAKAYKKKGLHRSKSLLDAPGYAARRLYAYLFCND